MGREIKFRGKRIDNEMGEFVYGSLFKGETAEGKQLAYIIPCGTRYEVMNGRLHRNTPLFEVDPETVGQFIWLRDSTRTKEYPEGQEIYDTDLLHNEKVLNYPVRIIFDKELGAYMIHTQSDFLGNAVYKYHLKVFGNSHDNPELITGPQL
ncbi:hypothetical protein E4K67_22545 [Desulfosporosinus fructosivorans]|uniref:YopX protein domain-containing protein n=1 Tax=Desulfosporosinus fructosivorans TaxID=2018669 RepID=A0A4Z0R040_9FIRM|nr:YopX family protein [Desulfosporosinus fructosivorans]TGE35899.1 hypothetical protein E4K67_22545 [Desulfosporosinus fructosivorans]